VIELASPTPTNSLFVELACSECERTYPAQLSGICECGGPLLARYEGWADLPRTGGLWSWEALLPPCEPVSLGEVSTPLIPFDGALIKDEGRLPTGTFKARGAAVGVAMARNLGAEGAVIPTAGNAGAAWAAYCANAGLPCAVHAIKHAPLHTLEMAGLNGAEVTLVDGEMGSAVESAKADAIKRGWHFAATFKEPWRVEGKKTALFEISRDLGWKMPDAVILPTGGGVGVIAFHQAVQQLNATEWATGFPRFFAVQAEGCAPVVKAFHGGRETVDEWPDPKTDAVGIRIPSPPAGKLLLQVLRGSLGGAVAVDEGAINAARDWVARSTGLILSLEAAASVAGYQALKKKRVFDPGETVVIYGTASGRL
jgi:threonine synthase